jgi:hypothetical protein
MAKISAIAKNNRRKKMAAKGEAKRAELRKVIIDPNATDDEVIAAQKKLQKCQEIQVELEFATDVSLQVDQELITEILDYRELNLEKWHTEACYQV